MFPVLHGEAGEDGALREVLALLGVPFVGSIGSACRVAFDKSIATTVVAEAGIRTPRQVALPHEIFRELGAQALVAALGDQIGFPMMVKPSRGGSALGCSKVQPGRGAAVGDGRGLRVRPGGGDRGVHRGHRGDRRGGRSGRRPGRAAGRWRSGPIPACTTTRPAIPRERPGSSARPSSTTSLAAARAPTWRSRVHDVLGLRDLSRTDLIVTADGEPVFLEVNVAPGMTETSAVPLAIEAAGWSLGKMCADLVRVAARRGGRVPAEP